MLTTVLLILVGWCVLSVPLAIVIGKALARRPEAKLSRSAAHQPAPLQTISTPQALPPRLEPPAAVADVSQAAVVPYYLRPCTSLAREQQPDSQRVGSA